MNAAVWCRAARNGYRPVGPATKSKPKSLRCSGGSAWGLGGMRAQWRWWSSMTKKLGI